MNDERDCQDEGVVNLSYQINLVSCFDKMNSSVDQGNAADLMLLGLTKPLTKCLLVVSFIKW